MSDFTNKSVRHLRKGDVLASGFVVMHRPYTASRLRSGRLYVEGAYPGSLPKRCEWNASTVVSVKNITSEV